MLAAEPPSIGSGGEEVDEDKEDEELAALVDAQPTAQAAGGYHPDYRASRPARPYQGRRGSAGGSAGGRSQSPLRRDLGQQRASEERAGFRASRSSSRSPSPGSRIRKFNDTPFDREAALPPEMQGFASGSDESWDGSDDEFTGLDWEGVDNGTQFVPMGATSPMGVTSAPEPAPEPEPESQSGQGAVRSPPHKKKRKKRQSKRKYTKRRKSTRKYTKRKASKKRRSTRKKLKSRKRR